jgi:hypothetical protein
MRSLGLLWGVDVSVLDADENVDQSGIIIPAMMHLFGSS